MSMNKESKKKTYTKTSAIYIQKKTKPF